MGELEILESTQMGDDVRFKLVTPKSKSSFMKTTLCQSYLRERAVCFPPDPLDEDTTERPDVFDALFLCIHLMVMHTAKGEYIASCLMAYNKLYDTCEIHEVCVNADWRGKGVCGELIKHVFGVLQARKVRQVQIFCHGDNPAACKCYSKLFTDSRKKLVHGKLTFMSFTKDLMRS